MVVDALPVTALIECKRSRVNLEVVVDVPVRKPVDNDLIDNLVAPVFDVGRNNWLFSILRDSDGNASRLQGAGHRGRQNPHGARCNRSIAHTLLTDTKTN